MNDTPFLAHRSRKDYGIGVSRNLEKAAKWFEKAASQGNVEAQFAMGLMYSSDTFYDRYIEKGANKDNKKAAEWYEKAAVQGHAGAMNNLAILYFYAKGVPFNKDKAIELWQKAADLGKEVAKENLKQLSEPHEIFSESEMKLLLWCDRCYT